MFYSVNVMLNLSMIFGLLGIVFCYPHIYSKHKSDTCGYSSCPKTQPGKFNVHLVPHTHDDVGWLKTVDQYYYGNENHIQKACVRCILDSVVRELILNPERKFVYVEIAFFWKWWSEQSDDVRRQVKHLVAEGRLEFVGGAWSMNDEATAHYHSIIDQFTWGFRKLNDTFGYCGQPKIGWQIDPFGHARETASIFAQLGFDGLFFTRLDYQDKDARLKAKTMEMIWEGSPSLGSKGDIFTSIFYHHYTSPRELCYDILCSTPQIEDNAASRYYNVDNAVNAVLNFVNKHKPHFRTNHVLVPLGGDFTFQNATRNFYNYDKLIRYVNQRQQNGSDVNIFYSTPSCYIKSLNEANLTWTTKQDDFFPYGSDAHSYWTGFFTSRPTLKYFERKGNNFLQVCKQLSVLANLGPKDLIDLDPLREAMGVMQHHDAVAGTEKQHVANDYAKQLSEGFRHCGMLSAVALSQLHRLSSNIPLPPLILKTCPLLNISSCSISANAHNIIVTVYNPLSRPIDRLVRLPVSGSSYTVRDPKEADIPCQVISIPSSLFHIPGRDANTTQELVFKASKVPPLGFRSYYISRSKKKLKMTTFHGLKNASFESDKLRYHFDKETGKLSSLSNAQEVIEFSQSLQYYIGVRGNNFSPGSRSSGAYIMRTQGKNSEDIARKIYNTVYEGPVVREIHQIFSKWASQVVREYIGEEYLEIEWLVGPIPIEDRNSKEVIARYSTNITNNGIFYTDSNGRETIQRKKNYRPTWKVNIEEEVAGNYYPVTTDISINNGNTELTIITDRSQGGSSLNEGQLELMVHRRLLNDDAFGVGEALNEIAYGKGLVARGTHWILLGRANDPDRAKRKHLFKQEKVLDSYIFLADAGTLDFDTWSKSYKLEFSGLTKALPDAVQILTLEPWKDSTYLLRLEHLYEKSDPGAKAVTVRLENVFSTFDVLSVRETTLGANQWFDESTRLKWRKEENNIADKSPPERSASAVPEITLQPKQIRTFVCDIKPKESRPER